MGQAIADAFNQIASNITVDLPSIDIPKISQASSRGVLNQASYNFNQTINANEFNPIRARKEMEQMLSRARYL